MQSLTSVALLLSIVATFASETEPLKKTFSVPASLSCEPYETDCPLGCCPYSQGVCCNNIFLPGDCCKRGQTCLPIIDICVGLEEKEDKSPILVSNRATPLRSLKTPCPSETTTCGPSKCCIFPNATCCSDGEHCCQNGYRCDLPNKRCMKNIENDLDVDKTPFVGVAKSIHRQKIFSQPSHKSCPGGLRQCPSYLSCCLNDEGNWDCCPNPSLKMFYNGMESKANIFPFGALDVDEIQMKNSRQDQALIEAIKTHRRYPIVNSMGTKQIGNLGNCCTTIFGDMCCTGIISLCTLFGCI